MVSTGQGPGLSAYMLGQQTGEASVTLTTQQMPSHQHGLQALNLDGNTTLSKNDLLAISAVGGRTGQIPAPIYAPMSPTTSFNPNILATAGGSGPHGNVQPYLTLNYCIALQGIFPQRP